MQWRVRALALRGADGAARGVEGQQRRRRAGAPPVRVEAAAIHAVAAGRVRGLERLAHLVGVHRRAAERGLQQAGGGERVVANHFGGQAQTRAAREPLVLRVISHRLRVGEAALAIHATHHDGLQQRLRVPAALDETQRQPVQHLGIKRLLPLAAEVLGSLHKAAPEDALPNAVHRDAREQRMVRRGEPLREAETIARRASGPRR